MNEYSINKIAKLSDQVKDDLESCVSIVELEEAKTKYLGKTGILINLLKNLSNVGDDEKRKVGTELNNLKKFLQDQIEIKKSFLLDKQIEEKLKLDKIDLTLPVRNRNIGTVHPISQVTEELIEIFASLGFNFTDGPEIEDDYHNFTALNIAENHPARQMQDTFYLNCNDNIRLLRTQTSSVQIRMMENGLPPFRGISIGKTYRSESDMTHTPMFHQIEGLVIDKNINMGHLKNCIIEFLKIFFNAKDLPVRFRPSFFPFTEPSAEVDIGCIRSQSEFKIGAGDKWMEILGCGMVHPNVLRNVNIDPNEYQGFAFGAGVERLAMLKYQILDLRDFFEGDIRWLKHYGFSAFNVPNLVAGLSK